ncbi:unnamed protein product [Musa textilis]
MGHSLRRRDAVGVCPVALHATRHVTGIGLQRGFTAVCVPILAKASRAGGQPLPSPLPMIDPPQTSPLLVDAVCMLVVSLWPPVKDIEGAEVGKSRRRMK